MKLHNCKDEKRAGSGKNGFDRPLRGDGDPDARPRPGGAGPRRDPPGDRRARLPHARPHRRGRPARAGHAAHELHLGAGHGAAARGDRALLPRALRRGGSRGAHRRDGRLQRRAAAGLRRAARRGRRGAALRPRLPVQPPLRVRARRRAPRRARGRGLALPAHPGSRARRVDAAHAGRDGGHALEPHGHARGAGGDRGAGRRWPASAAPRFSSTRSTTASPTAATRAPRSRRATTSS